MLARVRPADGAAGRGGQSFELIFTEQVQQAAGSVEIRDGVGEVVIDAASPTEDARRWTMALGPALVEGDTYTLHMTGFEDLAGNAMALPIEIEFNAPAEDAELALPGTTETSILAMIDGPDGLAFVSGAPIDSDSVAASSITVSRSGNEVTGTLSLVDASSNPAWDGRVLLWTPDDPAAYLAARYDVVLGLALIDVAAQPINVPPGTLDFFRHGQGDIVWSKPSETPLLGGSQVGNDRFLHGRPYIDSLGLYDHRARFYEPGTQLFLQPDPLGPVDSPNLYQAFGFDGMNVVDPWGKQTFHEVNLQVRIEAYARGTLRPPTCTTTLEEQQQAQEAFLTTVSSGGPLVVGLAGVTALSPPVGIALGIAILADGTLDHGIERYEMELEGDPHSASLGSSLGYGLGVTAGLDVPLQLITDESLETGHRLTDLERAALLGQGGGVVALTATGGGVYRTVRGRLGTGARLPRVEARKGTQTSSAKVRARANGEIVDSVTGKPLMNWRQFEKHYKGEGQYSSSKYLSKPYQIYKATGRRKLARSEVRAYAEVRVSNEAKVLALANEQYELLRDSGRANNPWSAINILSKLLAREHRKHK